VSVAELDVVPGVAPHERAPRRALRELLRKQTAVLGLALAAVVIVGALGAPLLAPADPLAMGARRFSLPSAAAWLGTDQFGRDLLSRLLFGARVSMAVSFSAVGLAACRRELGIGAIRPIAGSPANRRTA